MKKPGLWVMNANKSDEAAMAGCTRCAAKGRRGAIAKFSASRSSDLMAYMKAHQKH